ncbi:MAG: beta-galactosidase [Armatimonadota bacterium]
MKQFVYLGILLLALLPASATPPRYAFPRLPVLTEIPEKAELEALIPELQQAALTDRAMTLSLQETFVTKVIGVETPHVDWAQPWCKGALREALFVRAPGQWTAPEARDPVEICQRLAITNPRYAWVLSSLYVKDLSGGKADSEFVTHMYRPFWDRLHTRLRAAHPQVIVLPLSHLGFPYMTPEYERELARMVAEGAGVVLVSPPADWPARTNVGLIPNEIDDGKKSPFMDDIFPIEIKRGQASNKPGIIPVGRHFITDGVLFDRFAQTRFLGGTLRPGATVIATTPDGIPAVVISEYGKGRVVAISWDTNSAYIPTWPKDDLRNEPSRYWEHEFAFFIRAMLWAARLEPAVDVQAQVETPAGGGAGTLVKLGLRNRGPAAKFTAHVTLRDSRYQDESTFSAPLALGANNASAVYFDLGNRKALAVKPTDSGAARLSAGGHLVDIILRNSNGKVVNFATVRLNVSPSLTLAFAESAITAREGEQITARLTINSRPEIPIAGKAFAARWEVTDSWGRVRAREILPLGSLTASQTVSFTHRMDHVLGNPTTITARVLADGQIVQQASLPVYVPAYGRQDWGKDFMPMAWCEERGYTRELFYRTMRGLGFRGIYAWAWREELFGDIAGADLAIQLAGAGAGGVNMSVEGTKNKQNIHWWYSKPEEERRQAINNVAAGVGEEIRKYGATNLILCDEPGLDPRAGTAGETDFSPVSLQRFRAYLRNEYQTLQALNAQWETTFTAWDDVQPLLRSQAKELDNFGLWLEFRTFMDICYADNARQHQQVYEEACGIPLDVGVDGTFGFSHDIANLGMDYARLSGPKSGLFDYGYYRLTQYPHCQSFKIYQTQCGGVSGSLGEAEFGLFLNGGLASILFDAARDNFAGCGAAFAQTEVTRRKHEQLAKVSTLLAGSRRETPEIGILYTHPSYLLQQVLDAGGRGIGVNEHQQSRYTLERMCWDLQQPFRYVNYLRLSDDLKGLKLVLMTGCQALSPTQGETLRQFVEGGGILMADMAPGVYDLRGKRYAPGQGPVDGLFGVRRENLNIVLTTAWWDIGFLSPPLKELGIGAEWDASGVFERSLQVADGKALGVNYNVAGLKAEKYTEGMCPAFVYKETGKGCTLLLNFLLEQYAAAPGFQFTGGGNPLRVVQALAKKAGIRRSSTVKIGYDALPFYYVNRFYQDGGIEHCTVMQQYNLERRNPDEVTIDFGRKGHLYDVRAGAYLGAGASVPVVIKPGDESAKIISLLPYRVTGLTIDSPRQAAAGQMVKFNCRLLTSAGPVYDHCFRVEVAAPDGTPVIPYSGNQWARGGHLILEVPFALNDPAGVWRITVTDIVSGVAETRTLKLTSNLLDGGK